MAGVPALPPEGPQEPPQGPGAQLWLQLQMEDLQQPLRGLWCDTCGLPSVVRCVWATGISGRLVGVLAVDGCLDCGKVQQA